MSAQFIKQTESNPIELLGSSDLALFLAEIQKGTSDQSLRMCVAALNSISSAFEQMCDLMRQAENYSLPTYQVVMYREAREHTHEEMKQGEIDLAEVLSDTDFVLFSDASRRYLKAIDSLAQFDHDDDWDIEMYRDAKAGAFDDLAAQALKEYKSGKCQPL